MAKNETASRIELGNFLRAHRERLGPDVSAAHASRRRRTPGLRREEAAQAAGVSTIWYTRIEQGRAAAVSSETLVRLAQALRLGPAERAHLFRLAGRHDPAKSAFHSDALPTRLRQTVEAFSGPAYVMDWLWNVKAANAGAVRLFGRWIEAEDANLLHYVFTDMCARALIADWDVRAQRIMAEFRADLGQRMHDEEVKNLLGSLRANSPQFRKWWEEQHVRTREGGRRMFNHPTDGSVAYEQLTLVPADDRDYKLVMLLPCPST